ncbi:hypothetical protein VTK73DRAFT_3287 [Phialemonium thermophilum]|uniref:Uncharacterized protein n=1 Tax=Phialemonium thermophilum TaxID=223376 RepID=A0ABR3Y7M6_9PEZI
MNTVFTPFLKMTVDAQVVDPSLSSVLETSRATQEQALALVEVVAEALEAVGPGPLTAQTQADISRQHKILNTNLARLRGLHRAACFTARDTKALTAEARQEVDRLHLQLQNLHYEQRHLRDEIAACEDFKHKYLELPLVPVEEFLAQHPQHANDDENTLMIARIEHERAEREALEQQRQELLKRKQKLIADNKKRRDDLANLDKDLEKFIDAAKPIQKMFEKVV